MIYYKIDGVVYMLSHTDDISPERAANISLDVGVEYEIAESEPVVFTQTSIGREAWELAHRPPVTGGNLP